MLIVIKMLVKTNVQNSFRHRLVILLLSSHYHFLNGRLHGYAHETSETEPQFSH